MKSAGLFVWMFVLFFSISLTPSLHAADIEGSMDHPKYKRYEGSEIIKYDYRDYDELLIPLGKAKNSKELSDFRKVEGAVTHLTYKIPMGRSPLEVIRNYREELLAEGFTELYYGSKEELGNYFSEAAGYNTFIWSPNIPALTHNDDSQVFLAMERRSAQDNSIVMLYAVTNHFWASSLKKKEGLEKDQTLLQVDIVDDKTMEEKMVFISAEEMAQTISSSGKIALYGIFFDTDKATIKAESAQTITEIATLLGDNSSLKLLVVGHTDNIGAFDYNMRLSQERALAVVEELTANHHIKATRLKPVGVSYACPVATNNTEDGRSQNRRVELVANNQ